MSINEIFMKRKSTRMFLDKAVESDKLIQIAEAGNMAAGTPMAGKVYFNVVTNSDVLDVIVKNTQAVMQNSGVDMLVKISSNPNFNPFYGAPCAIVISADKTDNPSTREMAIANVACAGENILLAATELGLGSCYMTSPTLGFAIPETREAVKLEENMEPLAIVVVGYAEDMTPHSDYPENPKNIVFVE